MQPFVSIHDLKRDGRFVKWVGQREIMALHTAYGIRVFSGMCPHQGGPLGEGQLTPTSVTCPWHGCTFELKGGVCVNLGVCENLSNMKLQPVAFEVVNDMLCVDAS